MAGAIAEISRYTLAKDFRHIDPSEARVILIEGTPRLLAAYPPDLSESARKQLIELGVDVRTGARVTDIIESGVKLDGEFIPCRVKIWAAGNNARSSGKPLSHRLTVWPSYCETTTSPFPDIRSAGDWRPGKFFASNWRALAGSLTRGDATGAPRRLAIFCE
jgi:NADH dehydrogenase